MPLFEKRNSFSTDKLDSVLEMFKQFFEVWKVEEDIFSNQKPLSLDNLELTVISNLKEGVTKEGLDKVIKELRDGLKYNFFSAFWEKKENLKLIRELKKFLIEIDNIITKQNQEVLNLEKQKLLIEQNRIKEINEENPEVLNAEDYFSFFSFLSKKVNNDISYLERTNLIIINNKKNFLEECRKLKNKINKEIQEFYQKNEKLEEKNKEIFGKMLLSKNLMSQLILYFWVFRMKNNDNKYQLNLENAELENKSNKDFSFFFRLIDDIFNKYIGKIIKNEEKIFDDIFNKYSDQKSKLDKEKEKYIKNKNELDETIEKIKKQIYDQIAEIKTRRGVIEETKNHIVNLKKRKEDIEKEKITHLQDWEQNKDILENIENINKKQYLQRIEETIQEIEKDIENKDRYITELEYDNIRNNAELNINIKKLKKINKKIAKNQTSSKQNEDMMEDKLKKLKDTWIKKIKKNQKVFLDFFRKNKKLKEADFINFIENYWKIEENRTFLLTLNENFNIENNMQEIQKLNNQKEKEFKETFATLETYLQEQEKQAVQTGIEDTNKNLSIFGIQEADEVKEKESKETQTEFQQEKIIEELHSKIEKLELQIQELVKKIISITQEFNLEIEHLSEKILSEKNEEFKNIFQKQIIETQDKCETLKIEVTSKKGSQKAKNLIESQLIELELKLIFLKEQENLFNSLTQQESESPPTETETQPEADCGVIVSLESQDEQYQEQV